MALTKRQLKDFEKVEGLPVKKIICIAKASFRLYKCVKASGGDVEKILSCVEGFIDEVEKCLKKK